MSDLGKELVDQGVCCLLSFGPPADGRQVVLRPTGTQGGLQQQAAGRWVAQTVAVGGDAGLHGSAEALPQMEPVGHLQSTGGTAPGTLGVCASPVPANDLHAGVVDQPRGQRPSFTGGEHVDHAMVFDASQDGGVGLAAANREIVHAQHTRRAERGIGQCHDPAQQGHPSRAERQLGCQPCAGPTGQREPRPLQGMVEPRGEPYVRRGEPGERLSERPARAVRRSADEAPNRQPDHEALFSERKVLQPALLPIVDSVREAAAVRTCSPGRAASRHYLDPAERGRHRLDIHFVDPVEHQRVPERCIGLHDQHHHRPQPTAAAASRHLRERHFRLPADEAYAVSREPDSSQSNNGVTLRDDSPRSVPEPSFETAWVLAAGASKCCAW